MKNNLDVYVDKLSLFTFFIIFIKKKQFKKIRVFYYIKSNFLFSSNFFNFSSYFFNKELKLINLSKFEESKIFINNKSIFHIIWDEVDKILDLILEKKSFEYFENYQINNLTLDKKKFRGFFKENSVYLLYYPVKLITFSNKFSSNNSTLFILKKTPLIKNLREILSINLISYFDINFYYKKKYDLIYYEYFLKFYFFTRIKLIQILYFSIKDFIFGVLSKKNIQSEGKIFLEIHQREIDFENITDFFWFKYTKITNHSVLAVLFNQYDENSIKNLKENKVNFKYKKELHVSFIKLLKVFKYYFFILIKFRSLNYDDWEKCMFFLFYIKTQYWYEIFKNQNTKILFTMLDTDDDKFSKLNAIKLLNGISITSHWSNFPFCKVNNRKHADVLLAWGSHFEENIFRNSSYNKIYKIGYPSDHYFKNIREKYLNQEKQKFVITYMDNILYNDGFYSPSTNILIMKNFIKLLEKNKDLKKLYIKPKSLEDYNRYYGDKNKIDEFIKEKRIEVLFGKSINIKFCPAHAAAMSDLCVSIGIGTTAAESIFFGTPAFHLNNHKLSNKFIDYGKNKIVFNNITDLFCAIENSLTNKLISIDECKKISSVLDPYQDGNAAKRAGFIISFIFNYLNTNKSHEENYKNQILEKLDHLLKDENLFKINYKI